MHSNRQDELQARQMLFALAGRMERERPGLHGVARVIRQMIAVAPEGVPALADDGLILESAVTRKLQPFEFRDVYVVAFAKAGSVARLSVDAQILDAVFPPSWLIALQRLARILQ